MSCARKSLPIMTDIGRLSHIRPWPKVAARIERGEGNIGRVVSDDTLVREAEAIVVAGNSGMKRLDRLLAQLGEIAGEAGGLMREAATVEAASLHCCGKGARSLPTCAT